MSAKLLIVDDEEHNRELIEVILYREGYTLFFANNGEEALKILQHKPIDILLLDLLMPKMDGMSTLKKIKNFNQKKPYIIVITALGDKKNQAKALELGANNYLLKPFDIIDLKQRIRVALNEEIPSSSKTILSEKECRELSINFLKKEHNDTIDDLHHLITIITHIIEGKYSEEEIQNLKKKYLQLDPLSDYI